MWHQSYIYISNLITSIEPTELPERVAEWLANRDRERAALAAEL